jgi:hypothetical protein
MSSVSYTLSRGTQPSGTLEILTFDVLYEREAARQIRALSKNLSDSIRMPKTWRPFPPSSSGGTDEGESGKMRGMSLFQMSPSRRGEAMQ